MALLGVAQIISWGTLFYAIGVLGEPMRVALGASDVLLFGAFSAGMLLSGVVAPAVGRDIDAHGGRRMLAAGSVVAALSMALLAGAPNVAIMVSGWLLAGVASAAVLYDPIFAAIHHFADTSFRRSVTLVTLFGGFASTVFWPLSRFLLETVGWREAFALFALMHVAACLPIHLCCVPRGDAALPRHDSDAHAVPAVKLPGAYSWLALSLSLSSFVAVAVSAHLITLLTASGMAARDAVLVGSMIGPMQVAGRIVEYSVARDVKATTTALFALSLMAVALCVLTQVRGVWIVALLFVIAYGWANGVFTIARGTVPRALFGASGYGTLLGRLARPQFFARAFAPLAVSLVMAVDASRAVATYLLAALGIIALLALRRAIALALQPASDAP